MYLPAASEVPRPVAVSAPTMLSRSMPVAERSAPSGLRLSLPPRRPLTAEASCSASVADRLVTLVPNSMRDNTSSCGRAGVDEKAMSGFCAEPVTVMAPSTSFRLAEAVSAICGSVRAPPLKVMVPLSMVKSRPAKL